MVKAGIWILFLLLVQPALAASPEIREVSGEADYGKSYTFKVNGFDPDGDIIQAYLEYWWEEDTVRVRKPVFYDVPRRTVEQEVEVSAEEGWQPPGSSLHYQWFLKDRQGNVAASESRTIIYQDNRYDWKKIVTDHFEVYFYADKSNAQDVARIAEENFNRVTSDIGFSPKERTRIYIYATHEDYLKVGDASLRDWAGGSAYAPYNLFIIPASTDLGWLRQVVPHEFTHIVFDQKLGGYGYQAPLWLSEGIAMYEEDNPVGWEENLAVVGDALKKGELIPLTEMDNFTFRDDEEVALIYSESYTVIKFLIDTYGTDKFNAFIDRLSQGASVDEALTKAYQKDLAKLDAAWQEFLRERASKDRAGFININTLITAGIAFLLILAVLVKGRRDRRQAVQENEEGDVYDA